MYYLMQFVFFVLDIIYFFIKLFPTKNKVVFISRQSNEPSTDIILVNDQLHNDDPSIETRMLCRKLESGIKSKLKYIPHMFVQMYHIATSKCVVVDSYCIIVSCLHHKKDLKIIQMWHGGYFKKFGYSILGKGEGSSYKIAKMMHMHEKYDMVFCPSEYAKSDYSEAFNTNIEKVVVAPLPRVDLLRNKDYLNDIAIKIKDKYPELSQKKTILYAPTFRKDETKLEIMTKKLIDNVDYNRFNLIVCMHPLTKIKIDDPRVIIDNEFFTFEFGTVADFVITDYSAIVYEMAIMEKRIFYYVFDKDDYDHQRGLYISLDEFPGPKCLDEQSLLSEINKDDYDLKQVKEFVNKYIDPTITNCCAHISNLIRK